MSEESTASDLVELTRRAFEAVGNGDLDSAMSFYAPNAVWEAIGMGTSFEGVAAIRSLYQDWVAAYQQFEIEPEEIVNLGNGVVFAANRQKGRPVGSTAAVGLRQGTIALWVEGVIVRVVNYPDIDEGRAAAERLAEEPR
jgi:ketosteroid isomerase-like protein